MAKKYAPLPKAWWRFFIVLFALPMTALLIGALFSIG